MIDMTDAEYEQLYKSIVSLARKNATNLKALQATIGSGFDFRNEFEDFTTVLTDKDWLRGNVNEAWLADINSVYNEVGYDMTRTAEILFGAWYTNIVLIAFYKVCLNSIKKRVKNAGKDDLLVDGWLGSSKLQLIHRLVSTDYKDWPISLKVELKDGSGKYYEIDTYFEVPTVFYDTSLVDIIAGNINIDIIGFWYDGNSLGTERNILLQDIGVAVKEHVLDPISRSLK